jgi:hypothetical protein
MDGVKLKPGWLHEGKPQASTHAPQEIDYRHGDFLGDLLGSHDDDDDDDASQRFSNGKSNNYRSHVPRGGYSGPRDSAPYRCAKQLRNIKNAEDSFLYLALPCFVLCVQLFGTHMQCIYSGTYIYLHLQAFFIFRRALLKFMKWCEIYSFDMNPFSFNILYISTP